MIITYVANIKPYKNHKLLIDAVSLLEGPNVDLWLIGRDDGMESELIEYSRDRNVNAMFFGFRGDVGTFLKSTDIYAHSSSEEGCSNAIIESMRAGLPSVVTDVGGNPELVLHEITGFVSPLDAGFFCWYLLMLLSDPLLRKKMGRAAKERYEEYFTVGRMVENYKEFYESIG